MTTHPPRAFTLIEILVVLALLALVTAALLPAGGALLRDARRESAEDTTLDVLQEVRRQAVLSGREVTLGFAAESHALVWTDGVQTGRREFARPDVTVDFLRPSGRAILLGGQLVETNAVKQMKFYADGTCDTIRLQWRQADRIAHVIAIDPWTCAPALVAANP